MEREEKEKKKRKKERKKERKKASENILHKQFSFQSCSQNAKMMNQPKKKKKVPIFLSFPTFLLSVGQSKTD